MRSLQPFSLCLQPPLCCQLPLSALIPLTLSCPPHPPPPSTAGTAGPVLWARSGLWHSMLALAWSSAHKTLHGNVSGYRARPPLPHVRPQAVRGQGGAGHALRYSQLGFRAAAAPLCCDWSGASGRRKKGREPNTPEYILRSFSEEKKNRWNDFPI